MTYLTVDTLEGGGPLAPGLGVGRVGGEVDGEGLHPREDGVHLVPDLDPPLRGLQVSLTLRCRHQKLVYTSSKNRRQETFINDVCNGECSCNTKVGKCPNFRWR